MHCAYWKYDVRRRLIGDMKASFPLKGRNFWRRPSTSLEVGGVRSGREHQWKGDVALLDAEHQKLRDVVAAFPESRWMEKAPGKPFTYAGIVRGVAAHDLYHAGQIQLLKRL